ncbi:MAG: HEAT repeat domain-containing protein, partial [Melioribacteraceae bacterium]|nr:HEAT repeat domain-containing protein [Melioribacteraceae bacterium]
MSTDQLIDLLSDPNTSDKKQREAVNALGYRKDPRVLDVLSQIITENRHGVAFKAVEVLARHNNQKSYELLVKSLSNESSRATSILIDVGPPAVKLLINSLESDNPILRKNAVLVLGRIYSPKSVPTLIKILNTDEDSSVRKYAATALARLNDSRAIDPLIKAWADENIDVRREVSRALVSFGKRAIKSLAKIMLEHEDEYFRWRAAWCLGRINDSTSEDDLIKALDDDSPEVQWISMDALGKLGNEKSEKILSERLSVNDTGLSDKARDTLEWIKVRGDKAKEREYIVKKQITGIGKKQITGIGTLKVIYNENLEALKNLLNKEPDIINKCQDGWSPLMLTIESNSLDKAKILVEHGADPSLTCWIVPKKTRRANTPLHEAATRNLDDFVKLFLEHGVDVNKRDDTNHGYTPLIIAAGNKNYELSSYLISKGADPLLELRSGTISPLYNAFYSKDYTLIKLFLENLPEEQSTNQVIKSNLDNVLSFASQKADFQFVKKVVSLGADTNTKNRRDGRTPLIEAVENEHIEIVKYLLQNGAKPDLTDNFGYSALNI